MCALWFLHIQSEAADAWSLAASAHAEDGKRCFEITVNLGRRRSTVKVYDPIVGTSPIQTLDDVSSVPLTVTDHPVVLEL